MIRVTIRACLVCLALAACSGATTATTPPTPTTGPQRPPNRPQPDNPQPWANEIRDEATWDRLAARPQTQVVSRTEVVKLLMDLQDGRRVYFVDTALYDIHYFFARDHLARPGHPIESHGDFNLIEYRRAERRFILGSLVHYLDSDLWTFEMIAGDNLPGDRVLD
ncbi:MAG: hypothetical protein IT378_00560, partial [Sandaracinaceae bacterium]|nr:hypothetical protein [Sandaracinaceae bacterium]